MRLSVGGCVENSAASRPRSPPKMHIDAAEYTGDPDAMANALSVIQGVGAHEEAPEVDSATASMCIFGGERGLLAALFSTHPPTDKRIRRLREMAV